MQRHLFCFVLLAALAPISESQVDAPRGVPVGRVSDMPAPNYATKWMVAPSTRATPAPDQMTAVTYTVTFTDPGGTYASFYSNITSAIQAAGAEWNRYLTGSAVSKWKYRFPTSRP
ncbi:MAG: hypothetical protein ABIR71_00840 [Chthoniobacterales bacterium]